jgi:hypothetical protein
VKAALEFLPGVGEFCVFIAVSCDWIFWLGVSGVGTVEVRRDGGSVLGEFTWQITLDWEKGPLQLRGDWNPIIADASQLGGKWSGDGQSVVVRELRKGQKATIRGLPSADELLRANFTNQPLSSPTTPAFTVKGLLPLTLYQFRVRPINAIGAGDWSIVSPRIRTKAVYCLRVCAGFACVIVAVSRTRHRSVTRLVCRFATAKWRPTQRCRN